MKIRGAFKGIVTKEKPHKSPDLRGFSLSTGNIIPGGDGM
jgi:hypothetical protein